MITIDYVEKKDGNKYITITNSADSKNKNSIQIDLSQPSDWSKQNINNFIIRTVSIAEDKLELPKQKVHKNKFMKKVMLLNLLNLLTNYLLNLLINTMKSSLFA